MAKKPVQVRRLKMKVTSPSHSPFFTSHSQMSGPKVEKKAWNTTEKVQRKNAPCAHHGGLPHFGSICKARILAPMKSTASIGDMFTVKRASVKTATIFSKSLVQPRLGNSSNAVFEKARP